MKAWSREAMTSASCLKSWRLLTEWNVLIATSFFCDLKNFLSVVKNPLYTEPNSPAPSSEPSFICFLFISFKGFCGGRGTGDCGGERVVGEAGGGGAAASGVPDLLGGDLGRGGGAL